MEKKPSEIFNSVNYIEVLKILQKQGKLQAIVENFLNETIAAVQTFKIDKVSIVPGTSVYGGEEIHDYFFVTAFSAGEPKLRFKITDLSFKLGEVNDNSLWQKYLNYALSNSPRTKQIWHDEFMAVVNQAVETYREQLLSVGLTPMQVREIINKPLSGAKPTKK